MSELERLQWTKLVLVIALGWGLYHLRGLWQSQRACPRAPLFAGLPRLRHEPALLRVLLALLVAIGLTAQPVVATLAFAGLVGLFWVMDWTRCRPLLYQFAVMLLVVALCAPPEALGICRLFPVCVYFWSGLLKQNTHFIKIGYPWFIDPLRRRLPSWLAAPLFRMGTVVGWLEAFMGLGLLFPGTRMAALAAVVGMHVFILVCFSPLGHRTHGEIWPWNLGMAITDVILFGNTSEVSAGSILLGHSVVHGAALLLLGVLPVLGFFDKLDPVFSHAHMSSRHVSTCLLVSAELRARMPKAVQRLCRHLEGTQHYTLDLNEWSMSESRVPPPQMPRAVKSMVRDFARYSPTDYDLQMTMFWVSGLYRVAPQHRNYLWSELSP